MTSDHVTHHQTDPELGELETSLLRLLQWIRANRYRAYEPADGNASYLHHLTGKRVWPMRVLQQVVLRSPVNIRPLLGIRPHESAIARGYMANTYLRLHRRTSNPSYLDAAQQCFSWLLANASGAPHLAWGDPYEYATRSGRRPRGEPILIWTALIGQAFASSYRWHGRPEDLRAVERIGEWISALPTERTPTGDCLSYVRYKQNSVHNANAMGAAFMACAGELLDRPDYLNLARSSMAYTCNRQLADGAWWYGEEPKYHWVDNFHTGYNLSAIITYAKHSRDNSFAPALERGAAYFVDTFFEADGRPKYYNDRTFPVDIQCCAQAIETLVDLEPFRPGSLTLAKRVAIWTTKYLQASTGYFMYRQLPWTRVRTPMMHWGQATMAAALAALIDGLSGQSA